MSALSLHIPITKIDAAKRLVYGVLTEEVADRQGEILDYDSSKPNFEKWSSDISKASGGKSVGNLRVMHGNTVAGLFTDMDFDDANKRISVCAKVVDDNEWNKVEAGAYTGFSVGGKYGRRWADPDNSSLKRYTALPQEGSLVDLPAVPTATFEMIKANGEVELRKFHTQPNEDLSMTKVTVDPDLSKNAPTDAPNILPEVKQGWIAKDNSFHLTKDAALKKNAELEAASGVAADAQAALAKLTDAVDAAEGKEPGTTAAELGKAAETEVEKAARVNKEADDKAEKDKADAAKAKKADAPADDEKPKGKVKFKGAFKSKKDAKKAVLPEELEKGLCQVARAACLIEEISWLHDCIEMEATYEEDDSPQPKKLEGILVALCSFLRDLVAEETAELTEGADAEVTVLAAGAGLSPELIKGLQAFAASDEALKKMADIMEKAGARHSKTDLNTLKDIHDHASDIHKACMKMGMKTDDDTAEKSVLAGALLKAAAERDQLSKVLTDMVPQLTKLNDRIEHLEAQPLPAKGVKRVVSKSADGGGAEPVTQEDLQKQLAAMSPRDRQFMLMKASLANGVSLAASPEELAAQ